MLIFPWRKYLKMVATHKSTANRLRDPDNLDSRVYASDLRAANRLRSRAQRLLAQVNADPNSEKGRAARENAERLLQRAMFHYARYRLLRTRVFKRIHHMDGRDYEEWAAVWRSARDDKPCSKTRHICPGTVPFEEALMIARLKKARDLGIPDELVEKILGEISESMKHKAFCDRRYKRCKELLEEYEKKEHGDGWRKIKCL